MKPGERKWFCTIVVKATDYWITHYSINQQLAGGAIIRSVQYSEGNLIVLLEKTDIKQ